MSPALLPTRRCCSNNSIRGMTALGVMTADGRVYPVESILASDLFNDLAILKVKATGLKPLAVTDAIDIGDPVFRRQTQGAACFA